MPFSIKLTFDPSERYLIVQREEETTPLSAESFLVNLKKCLHIITEAAQRQVSQLQCCLPEFVSYMEAGLILKKPWQPLPEGFLMDYTFPMMRNLIFFLQEEGHRRFPHIFKERHSAGFTAIRRSLHTLTQLQQTQEGLFRPIPPVGSRKRKAFPIVKRPVSKKPALEFPSSSASTSIASPEKMSVDEQVPSGSKEEVLPLLTSQPIELFESHVCQGSDSEDEVYEQPQVSPQVQRSVEVLTPVLLPLPRSRQSELPSTSKTQTESTLSSRSLPKTLVIPIFCIEKLSQARRHTFCLKYEIRLCNTNTYALKRIVNNTLKVTLNNLKELLEFGSECIIKWEEPFLDKSKKIVLKDKWLVLIRTLQGIEASYQYLFLNHDALLERTLKVDNVQNFMDIMTCIKEELKDCPAFILSQFSREKVSEATPFPPSVVLEKLVKEKTSNIVPEKKSKTKIKLIPTPLKRTVFTYVFSIDKKANATDTNLVLSYRHMETHRTPGTLSESLRRSLKSSLRNVQQLLDQPGYFKSRTYKDPFSDETEDLEASSIQLYQILLKGLQENYFYITQNMPAIFDEKNFWLKEDLMHKIDKVKATLAKLIEASDEVVDIDIDEEEGVNDNTSSIISELIKKIQKENYISLQVGLGLKASKLTDISLRAPYIFTIRTSSKTGQLDQYKIEYIQKKDKKLKVLLAKCRQEIIATVKAVEMMLQTSPSYVYYWDHEMNISRDVTENIWRVVLEGLLEMKLFYGQRAPGLMEASDWSHPGKVLDDVIERILSEKSNLCGEPITESTILRNLLPSMLQRIGEPAGQQEDLSSNEENE